jgi:type I restriction enzyme S subunit
VTCIGATIGKVGFARISGTTNQQINAIIPEEGISPEMLYWKSESPHFYDQILSNASAITLPILNKSRLNDLLFAIPPSQEQKKIAHIIENKICRNTSTTLITKQLTQKLHQLDQAILAKAFRGELVAQDAGDEPASVLLERIKAEREAEGVAGKRGGRKKK